MTAPLDTLVSVALCFGCGGGMVYLWLRRRGLANLLARAELLSGKRFKGFLPFRALQAIEALLDLSLGQGHRLYLTHSVTGLPTREPLAARMSDDGCGTLGLLACKDYDRLCAFDAQLADRLLVTIVERIGAMVPASRFLAQVDRCHLAIWIGADAEPHKAKSEIDALAYALGDRLVIGERELFPEVAARTMRYDAGRLSPQAAISQTLSSFSVTAAGDADGKFAPVNLEHQARERFQLEQDLRRAIARNQLRMQYQPLIDAAGGRVCGAEALIRWHHPQRGVVPPSRFIPVAEAAGLSQELGLWALNHAARDARSWQMADLATLRIAVNVTFHQLETQDLALLITRTLERHCLQPEALEIELTESVALADDARASAFCDQLRRMGVRIAIDDFGTGYSSLGALRTLAFDKIKVDRSFVTDVHKQRDSQAICKSVFALGRGLGISVLAEGVEQEAEYRWLRQHGCRYFQGFYFAKPLDSDQFVEFARERQALARLLWAGESINLERIRA